MSKTKDITAQLKMPRNPRYQNIRDIRKQDTQKPELPKYKISKIKVWKTQDNETKTKTQYTKQETQCIKKANTILLIKNDVPTIRDKFSEKICRKLKITKTRYQNKAQILKHSRYQKT